MQLADFDYHLPQELIAQSPLEDRASSRMLVLNRASGDWSDRTFRDLPALLSPDDCLVLNNSRVFPSRLFGTLPGRDKQAEIFLLHRVAGDPLTWQALVRPGRHLPAGACVRISGSLSCEILTVAGRGERTVRFITARPLEEELERHGHMPLPPYIKRPDNDADRQRYQTIYAAQPGSVAAPTAGLHFTALVLEACRATGAAVAHVTLHVGLGTFQPLSLDRVEDNHLHEEAFEITAEAARTLRAARRLVAAGTTSVRVLESAALRGGLEEMRGETSIFIYPGFRFAATGALLTNFHLPKSSLLMLVCAFAGRDLALAAYHHAVRERYRFFSYGDCMLIT